MNKRAPAYYQVNVRDDETGVLFGSVQLQQNELNILIEEGELSFWELKDIYEDYMPPLNDDGAHDEEFCKWRFKLTARRNTNNDLEGITIRPPDKEFLIRWGGFIPIN